MIWIPNKSPNFQNKEQDSKLIAYFLQHFFQMKYDEATLC